jgi:hypothetical protein
MGCTHEPRGSSCPVPPPGRVTIQGDAPTHQCYLYSPAALAVAIIVMKSSWRLDKVRCCGRSSPPATLSRSSIVSSWIPSSQIIVFMVSFLRLRRGLSSPCPIVTATNVTFIEIVWCKVHVSKDVTRVTRRRRDCRAHAHPPSYECFNRSLISDIWNFSA